MAKSRAEIQKAYRERKIAKEGREYYERESRRRMKNYVKSSELTRRERLRRNAANRAAVQRCRQRKKEAKELEASMVHEDTDQEFEASTSGYSSDKIIVSLNFSRPQGVRRAGTRKRTSRAFIQGSSRDREAESTKSEPSETEEHSIETSKQILEKI